MTMRIKLHNSLAKRSDITNDYFFNNKTYIERRKQKLHLCYNINDWESFLSFNIVTKHFKARAGFGKKNKISGLNWWTECGILWRDLEKEEQST